MTQRYCKVCTGWHDLDEPWPDNCLMQRSTSGPQVIRDMDPYMSVAADKATGEQVAVGGRAQHREFLRRNNYVEVGNDSSLYSQPKPKALDLVRGHEIKAAIEQVRSGHERGGR